MESLFPEYEFPIHGVSRVSGKLPVAGVYYLGGDCHIVGEGSPHSRELTERGALRVATVRFDRDPLEGAGSGHAIRPLDLSEAVRRFVPSPAPDHTPPGGRLPASEGPI